MPFSCPILPAIVVGRASPAVGHCTMTTLLSWLMQAAQAQPMRWFHWMIVTGDSPGGVWGVPNTPPLFPNRSGEETSGVTMPEHDDERTYQVLRVPFRTGLGSTRCSQPC